jgi:hypothetical protein
LGGRDNSRQAVSDATNATTRLVGEASPSPELVAAAQLDLASAHLASDELDRATTTMDAVLDLPAERRTAPITGRAAKIDSILATSPYAGGAGAAALREKISLFMAYPAMRAYRRKWSKAGAHPGSRVRATARNGAGRSPRLRGW